ncbi:MAG: AtpZ/AtpI family protein [Armatimonadetes bacterium]|nr:AtpZ/AtpI family protein [Armatimonadota bacterium]
MEGHDAPGPTPSDEEAKLRRIEDELAKVAAETRLAEPDHDAFGERLKQIESQARSAKTQHHKGTPEGSTQGMFTPESGRGLARGLQAAYAIIGVPIAGWVVGWLIDRAAGTGVTWQGVLTMCGAALAVLYVIKTSSGPS